MSSGDEYRHKALVLCGKANHEQRPEIRREYENLAFAYMRLAEIAERDWLAGADSPLDEGWE